MDTPSFVQVALNGGPPPITVRRRGSTLPPELRDDHHFRCFRCGMQLVHHAGVSEWCGAAADGAPKGRDAAAGPARRQRHPCLRLLRFNCILQAALDGGSSLITVRRRSATPPPELRDGSVEATGVDWRASVLLNLVLQTRYLLSVATCG